MRQFLVEEIIRRFPEHIDTTAAKGVSGVIAWQLVGFGNEIDTFALIIEDGIVWTSRQIPQTPDVTLRLGVVTFLKLATGHGDPSTMALSGDLELDGDAGLALSLLHFVRIPTDRGPAKLPTPSTVDVGALVRVIRGLPDRQLRERLHGPVRKILLAEIFRRMPDYLDPQRAAGVHALVVWQITGGDADTVDEYRTLIDDGRCEVGPDIQGQPRVRIRTDPATFFKVVTGTIRPFPAWLKGQISVRGNLLFASRLPRIFKIPSG